MTTSGLQRLRTLLDRLLADGEVVAELDGRVHALDPVAVPREEGDALRRWVIAERATHTVEIGLGFAVSTLFICDGLLTTGDTDARHVAIDPNQREWYGDAGLQTLHQAGLDGLVDVHAEESQLALPRFIAEQRTFDLAFVDGNHRFERVFLDLAHLARLVKPHGVVFVDDVQVPAIAKAVSFFERNLGWQKEEISTEHPTHHWAVLRTSERAETPSFEEFVDF